jgi:DNA recombination protein RmuC
MVIVIAIVLAVVCAAAVAAYIAVAVGRASRDATVRAAVESVLGAADQQLGQRTAASSRELSLHRDAIGDQLHEMGDELHRLRDLVVVLQRDRAAQHGELTTALQQTLHTTKDLAGTTSALREALASPKARGQWGERMADDVLRAAGLIEGVNYRKQSATSTGTVPDFTFMLPRGVELHMDVKFPVDNYLRYLEATTDAVRDQTERAFLRDVRNRIKELAGRGYADPVSTVGYLLLFIPNESVYSFIQEHDRDVADHALGQRVVLCSPFTLFAVLGVVRQAVDSFLMERASDAILDALVAFGEQWTKFSDCVDRLGKQLGTVQGTYDDLAGTRRRQLERRLDAIETIRQQRGHDLTGDARTEPILREVKAV